jgi:hypothetical protein
MSAKRIVMARHRLDTLVFWGAIAVLGLHAAVDAFAAPEPGTEAGDHLPRGLASLALLALAAALYPRLRVGGRAALAAVLGVLALEGAALAIADASAVGPRGEDWTGFLLAPVGLVLIVPAAVVLWRSRKPNRPRYLRRAGITVAAALAAYWLVVPVAMAILATHRPRAGRARHPRTALRAGDGAHQRRPATRRLVRPLPQRRGGGLIPDA